MKTCGSCLAGILLVHVKGEFGDGETEAREVQVCDECKLFETDGDASAAVETLLGLLAQSYEKHDTVADALDHIAWCVGVEK